MTVEEFSTTLEQIRNDLNGDAQQGLFLGASDFEQAVAERIERSSLAALGVTYQLGSQAFPDVRINGFGVEAKFKTAGEWREVANSVFEGSRHQDVAVIFVMFCQLGKAPEVRVRRYDEAIVHVRTSHVPRFVISMDSGDKHKPLFESSDGIEISYEEFRKLSNEEKMVHVREYARKKHPGEFLWWMSDGEAEEQSSEAVILRYTNLDKAKKRQLAAEGLVLIPECMSTGKGGNNNSKSESYSKLGIYWIRAHGVYSGNIRDAISAGSMLTVRGGVSRMQDLLTSLQEPIEHAIASLSDELFSEYWGEGIPRISRRAEWIKRAKASAGSSFPERTFL